MGITFRLSLKELRVRDVEFAEVLDEIVARSLLDLLVSHHCVGALLQYCLSLRVAFGLDPAVCEGFDFDCELIVLASLEKLEILLHELGDLGIFLLCLHLTYYLYRYDQGNIPHTPLPILPLENSTSTSTIVVQLAISICQHSDYQLLLSYPASDLNTAGSPSLQQRGQA